MKILHLFLYLFLFLFVSLLFTKPVSAETNIFKPQLSWQRSTEAQDKVVIETSVGQKVEQALSLPLDPNQQVFDNGVSTPQVIKDRVPQGVIWASWIQYSPNEIPCFGTHELRHFQAKFNLSQSFNTSSVLTVKLVSSYYGGDVFPINDNAYIYVNGNFITRIGTSYGASGHGGFWETDGWYANGNFGISPAQYLQPGQNTIDIAAGERCDWGGMDQLDLVLEIEGPIPSPSPSPSPGPTPFLDLPWDYQGLSFTEAALAINSYFDHEYPLLSSGLSEPAVSQNSTTTFRGEFRTPLEYSTHDGYDWGKRAKANINDPVFAATTGCASYFKGGASGNAIEIDHGNGYQTRYYHLSDNGLVTKSSTCTNVTKGQQIGRVGATGNVIPPGDLGAHIHFMVIQDKNKDGNFDDNIPDGVTDPFGWQSTESDPWSNYSFNYAGQDRTGNPSFYLWTKPIANLSDQLSSNGGFFELEKFEMEFPQGATDQNLTLDMQMAPVAKPSNLLESIGSTLIVTAKNTLGQFVEEFTKPYTIKIDFNTFDLTTLNLATISIYSSDDGINWNKENTTVDLQNKEATAQLNHLSHFALMVERLDIEAPITTAIINGAEGKTGWFRSDVQVGLDAQDNAGGLGVDYTLYKIDDGDWQEYSPPLNFSQEGTHTVQFYSVDKDENIEEIRNISFNIDKTPPIATINVSPNILWPPNGRLIDVLITGEAIDNNQYLIEVEDEYDEFEPTISNFGQTIKLKASRRENDKNGREYKIKVADFADNVGSVAEILVPHDRRKT